MDSSSPKLPVISIYLQYIPDMADISELHSNPGKLAPEITKACKEWGFVSSKFFLTEGSFLSKVILYLSRGPSLLFNSYR